MRRVTWGGSQGCMCIYLCGTCPASRSPATMAATESELSSPSNRLSTPRHATHGAGLASSAVPSSPSPLGPAVSAVSADTRPSSSVRRGGGTTRYASGSRTLRSRSTQRAHTCNASL
jgi:hypothetical protein